MYSQNEEEQYILESVADIDFGRIWDIGAWYPIEKSNSRALIEKGWAAALVEPSPGPFHALVKEYGDCPKVDLFNCAIGTRPGFVQFHISDDGVTTDSQEHFQTWKEIGGFIGKAYIWRAHWRDLGIWDAEVISIDTEGGSIDLWIAMSNELRPRVWCVEIDGSYARHDLKAIANGRDLDVIYESNENFVMRQRKR